MGNQNRTSPLLRSEVTSLYQGLISYQKNLVQNQISLGLIRKPKRLDEPAYLMSSS